MKTVFLISLIALSVGCGTMSQKGIEAYCSQEEKIKIYGSYDKCVSGKQAQNEQIENGTSPGQKFFKGMGSALQQAGKELQKGDEVYNCSPNGFGTSRCVKQ